MIGLVGNHEKVMMPDPSPITITGSPAQIVPVVVVKIPTVGVLDGFT
jgi:hypothetical protein